MKYFFIIVASLLGFSVQINAQVTASAHSTATIVSPLAISKTADLNFGNMAVTSAAGSIVTLAPTAAATRTESGGGVTFPAFTGTVSAASFVVSGVPGYTFDVTLPGGTLLENGPSSMFANNFTKSAGAGVLDAFGMQAFYVGADLIVAAAQPAGVYTTITPFVILVNYN